MNKLQMVGNIILTEVGRVGICSIDDEKLQEAWNIVDKMQAEADKREKEDAEKKRADMRELTNANNTFIEKEGQHFDDVEWQPDWSQAPDWSEYWYMTRDNKFQWCSKKPYQDGCNWFVNCGFTYTLDVAPSFGYTGDWRKSLRRRPL